MDMDKLGQQAREALNRMRAGAAESKAATASIAHNATKARAMFDTDQEFNDWLVEVGLGGHRREIQRLLGRRQIL